MSCQSPSQLYSRKAVDDKRRHVQISHTISTLNVGCFSITDLKKNSFIANTMQFSNVNCPTALINAGVMVIFGSKLLMPNG